MDETQSTQTQSECEDDEKFSPGNDVISVHSDSSQNVSEGERENEVDVNPENEFPREEAYPVCPDQLGTSFGETDQAT